MTELPPGATPISTEDLLQCIGQLYVQTQVLQRLLANQSQQLVAVNGRETVDSTNS